MFSILATRTWGLAVAAVGLAAVAGCGTSSDTSGTSADSGAASASISAPRWNAGDAAGKLLGLWVAGDRKFDDTDEKSIRMEQALAECTMRFEFCDAERVRIQLGRDAGVEDGRWEIVRSDGASLVVRITSPSCGEREFLVEFVDDNRFQMSQYSNADNGLAFMLTRIRGAS